MTNEGRGLIDPLAALLADRQDRPSGSQLVSLSGYSLEIEVRCGLVVARATRTFENRGKVPIEALLSFPVPPSAVCYELTAEIGGQVLHGKCIARPDARDKYEGAIDPGQAAVLYEEVLRGIHFLSVGNLDAGEAVKVSVRWVDSIIAEGRCASYRIPMTLGQVYGQSGLPETDEPITGGPALQAELQVRHDARAVMLASGALVDTGDGTVAANVSTAAPIDLRIDGWKAGSLGGRSRTGRSVRAEFMYSPPGNGALDVAVLVDVSGSMADRSGGRQLRSRTKYGDVKRSLQSFAARVSYRDRLSLWEFNAKCREVDLGPENARSAMGPRQYFTSLIGAISAPGGGSEIGHALSASESSGHRDVLLITDGLSHELDVQQHARKGRRIFVILVGEDSLEARVGHLAALTGGGLHYIPGRDVTPAVMAVLDHLRSPWNKLSFEGSHSEAMPRNIRAPRGSANVDVHWGEQGSGDASSPEPIGRAVAAFAAGITLPMLSEKAASRLATSEGIATHFTSLVSVDENEKVLISQRVVAKLRLAAPRTQAWPLVSFRVAFAEPARSPGLPGPGGWPRGWPPKTEVWRWLRATGCLVNWTSKLREIEAFRLDRLPLQFAMAIRILATHRWVEEFAAQHQMEPVQVAIALVASAERSRPAATALDSVVRGQLRTASFREAFVALRDDLARLPRQEFDALAPAARRRGRISLETRFLSPI